MVTHEICYFRLIMTPCCNHLLCWVNPRLPSFCPECGTKILAKLRTEGEWIRVADPKATLKVTGTPQGTLGGFPAPEVANGEG